MKLRLFYTVLFLLVCYNTYGMELLSISRGKITYSNLVPIKNRSYVYPLNSSIIDSIKNKDSKTSNTKSNKDGGKGEDPIVQLIDEEVGRYFKTLGLFIQGRQGKQFPASKEKSAAFNPAAQEREQSKASVLSQISSDDTSDIALRKGKEVIGFHPYWMGKTYENYDYGLLSSIAYFSYELNPETGNYLGYERMYDWKTTPLIKRAQSQGCKVYLTVTNFEAKGHRIFLNNEQARSNSIRIISELLTDRSADGVVINFEGIPEDLDSKFTSYITELSEALRALGKSVLITLPPIPDRVFDTTALNKHVAYFIVMGKNYYVKNSDIAGPVAPLRSGAVWKNGSLESTIDNYLKLGIAKEKIILSLPHYGSKWKTEDGSVPSKSLEFNDFLKYKTIKKKYPIQPNYDPISKSAYLNVFEDGDHYQIWFDDAKTLAEKFNFILENDLAGVGIWALGYDDGYQDLRKALIASFAHPDGDVEGNGAQGTAQLPEWLVEFKNFHVLKALMYFLIFIFGLGLLLSLRNFEVREIVFRRRWIKYVVIIGVPALLLFIIFSLSNSKYAIVVFLGLLLGYLIYYFVNRTEDLDNNVNRVV